MKHPLTKLLFAFLLLTLPLGSTFAGDNFWRFFPGKEAPSKLPMTVVPDHYTLFTLDQASMKQFLNSLSTNPDEAVAIVLPDPNQETHTFMVWKTPVMAKELADKYPDIQTFTAYDVDNQNITAKLDYTPYGFRAIVFDGENTYLIDPYSNQSDGYYVAFYEKDYRPVHSRDGCLVGSPGVVLPHDGTPVNLNEAKQRTANKQFGSVRRSYRLAISCTGEYALAVAGPNPTVPLVLSKIVSTINRVNGVYERELSVNFQIIAGDEVIIYTDPSTDPYSCNNNLECLINEVQSTITNTIGAPNYDVGHILCTAGGGLAALQAVCSNFKASGTSTSGGPDDYGVILHEMGHQVGANHTFSANTGGCNGNGNPETNFEPGSGSTIMSYAGLCDPNNIQFGSDEYFNVGSLNEIYNFLTTTGATCGTTTQGTPPVVLPNLDDTFNIPKNTPFQLTAPVAVPHQSGAVVTYTWEQNDTGNFGSTEAQGGSATSGPVMRSYPPDTSLIRAYPSYDSIINESYSYPGVRLPQVARALHFKVTARSLYQGWGTFNFIDSNVTILVANQSQFRVTAPSANETWDPGDVKTITWDKGGSGEDPINCGFVNIYLSLDNGKTFDYVVVSNAPNTGSYDYTVPDVYTTKGRIMVKGTGNVFFDIGKGKLNITGTNSISNQHLSEFMDIYPNPATDHLHIRAKEAVHGSYKVVVYNMLGVAVWEGQMEDNLSIATGRFARGNYLVQIQNTQSGKTAIFKVALR